MPKGRLGKGRKRRDAELEKKRERCVGMCSGGGWREGVPLGVIVATALGTTVHLVGSVSECYGRLGCAPRKSREKTGKARDS